MDPNATLEELRKFDKIADQRVLNNHEVLRILELVAALDDWLSKGGFLPDAWTNGGPRL